MWRFALAIVSLVIVAGCGKETRQEVTSGTQSTASPAKTEVASNEIMEEYHDFMNNARTQYQLGETNRVIEMMTDAYENEKFPGFHGTMFNDLMQMLQHSSRWDQSLALILNAKDIDSDTLVRSGLGFINALEWLNRYEDVIKLTEHLMPLVEDQPHGIAILYQRQVLARFELDQFDVFMQQLPDYMGRLGWLSNDIFRSFQIRLIQLKQLERAEALLVEMERLAPDEEWVTSHAAIARLDLFKTRKAWEDAVAHFVAVAEEVSSNDLKAPYKRFVATLKSAQRKDLIGRLAEELMESPTGKTPLGADASREWIVAATDRQEWSEVMRRLEWLTVNHAGDPAVQVAYEKSVYHALKSGDSEVSKSFAEFGERMLGQPLDADERNRVKQNVFNVAFLLEDYDKVIAILEEGLSFEESWHNMALNKARAHKALKTGNKREAVERFNAFIKDTLNEFSHPEIDPSTGMIYSKEMILGFNSRRVGDLLTDLGENQEAEESYKQAISYYETALNKLAVGSGEFEYIMDELEKIPN